MSATFGDLRSILQSSERSPAERWARLTELIETFHGDELEEVILPYCLSHLERIPLEVRRVPLRWLELILRSRELPFLPIVAVLDTEGRNMRLENIGAEVIAKTPHLDNLRVLALRRQLIHPSGLEHLLAAPWMENLERLHLDENLLGDSGIQSLATSAPWPSLKVLSVRACGIARGGVARLFDSSLMLHLEDLDLSRNELGWGIGATMGARLPRARRLERLALRRGGLVSYDAKSLGATIAQAPALETLEIGENALGDEALADMIAAMNEGSIARLSLEQNGVGAASIRALAGVPSLRHVTLAENQLPRIAPLTRHPRLTSLSISKDLGSEALAGCFHTAGANLTHLNLANGVLDMDVLLELATSPLVETLTHLSLDAASLQPAHIDVLCNTTWRNLEHLSLRLNNLGDEEVRMIASARGLRKLSSIDLTHNIFDAASARALADLLAANRSDARA